MLKFLYEIIVSPLGLPIETGKEWIILAVIEVLAYEKTYELVGRLYSGHYIYGKESGSILHWLIRTLLFIGIWAAIYGIIWLYYIVMEHRIVSCITLAFLILTIASVKTMQWLRERKDSRL